MPAENDPIDLLLDSDGDLDLSIATDLQLSRGLAAVAQGIRIRIETFFNEWFLDLDLGVDWFGVILGQKYNEARVRAEIRKAINDTTDDIEITRLETDFDGSTRNLRNSWEVRTAFSDTPINDELALVI